MPEATTHTFPASQALQLITLLGRWDITPAELLAGSGLTESELERPDTRLSLDTLRALTRRARALTGEPGLGIYLGLQKQASMYGHMGFATMTAATVRDALELAIRFTPLATTALTLSLHAEGDVAVLRIDEHLALGDMEDVAAFSFAVGMLHLFSGATGVPAAPLAIDFRFREPAYFARFAHVLPNARFGRPIMRVTFPNAFLDTPLRTADRAGLSVARAVCEQKLAELGFASTFAARVRKLVLSGEGARSLPEVARALHVSPRTLKRRLAAERRSFAAVCDEERAARALTLLDRRELSLDQVAERLGYSSPSNFVRAFRRWTGKTPAAYRSRA